MNLTLVVDNLRVKKIGRMVLGNVSAVFPAGSVTAVVGPNGAGKSTLLRALAGVDHADSGTVIAKDTAQSQTTNLAQITPQERAQLLAWVPDHHDAPFAYTVLETVLLGRYPWHAGNPQAADVSAAESALANLGIAHLQKRHVTAISSGERQRTMLARALAAKTPVLLLDEPLANLDIGAGLRLLGYLRQLTQAGQTVVLSLHDLGLAYRHCDYLVCLDRGKIAAVGTPATALTAELLQEVFGITMQVVDLGNGLNQLFFSVEKI